MKRMWQIALIIPLCILLGGVVTLLVLSWSARKPDNLGVSKEGRLAPCPGTPNCVCTQAAPEDGVHRMDPIPFEGSSQEALRRIKVMLATMPRVRIVSETENYLHAEFTSLVFRFVDDVEFYVDAQAQCIHFRSASRVGRSDLGVNRQRMEAFRQAFAAGNR
jgi:uncharacterized protein (DUF1499 family)